MKRLSRLLLGILSCFVLLYSTAHAESDRAFLSKTIRAKLTEPSEIFNAKYGRRSITLKRLATSECEMRLALWTLMGEPVQTYEFRMPQLREMVFEADDDYTYSVTIGSNLDDSKENEIIYSGYNTVFVSQDVLDEIEYVDFSFSLQISDLKPLPGEFYSVDEYQYYSGAYDWHLGPYIHMNNPGALESAGQWGWDTPGSPQWDEFLSKYEYPLEEGKTRLPKEHYMEGQKAKEAFRRMRWRYHNERKLFVNNWFDIHHLRVNPSRILNQIHKHAPEAYAEIMERD